MNKFWDVSGPFSYTDLCQEICLLIKKGRESGGSIAHSTVSLQYTTVWTVVRLSKYFIILKENLVANIASPVSVALMKIFLSPVLMSKTTLWPYFYAA